jgi:hypothetical protein
VFADAAAERKQDATTSRGAFRDDGFAQDVPSRDHKPWASPASDAPGASAEGLALDKMAAQRNILGILRIE